MKNLQKRFGDRVFENSNPKIGDFCVLNHGDLWVNNIMFRYPHNTHESPEDVVFIDYQCSFFASPGIDLNYFFNTSVPLDLFKNKRIELLGQYYNSLRETMESLNLSNIPNFEFILDEYKKLELYGKKIVWFILLK